LGKRGTTSNMAALKTCFLIDDDHDDQLIFTLALKQVSGSLMCVTANNGFEALEKLGQKGFLPDYIFMDLNMPGMNGIECLLKIKGLTHLRNIPVVIYTTSSNQQDILETNALGAYAFITKPYHIADLSQKLHEVFGRIA
jgi:CheY-like chemotaxis protein